ncbi:MAG: TonB-dependent receptor [Candidatus Zhuqueibacterota bacterium]
MFPFFRYSIALSILLLLPGMIFSQQARTYTIAGKIVNEKNQPLQGVNIFVSGQSIGTTTDERGAYKITLANNASLTLMFQFIGFKKQSRTIRFDGSNHIQLNIALVPEILSMPGVEVSEQKYEPNVGIYEIKPTEIRTIPGFYSDALSVVKTLPGVISNNEMSNTFHVHGGSSNDNLILLESIRLPQPQQIRNSYQEGFSQINPSLVKNFQLMTGGFSARYGEKMHSVLIADYKNSAEKPVQGEFEVGLINAGLTISGRAFGSGYWAIAGRWADTGAILQTLQTEGQYHPKFMDLQVVGRIPLTYRHRLSVIGMLLRNQFVLTPEKYRADYSVFGMMYNQFEIDYNGNERSDFNSNLVSLTLESLLTSDLKMAQSLMFTKNEELDRVDLTGDVYNRQNIQYDSGNAESTEYLSTEVEFRNNSLHENTMSYQNELTYSSPNHALYFGVGARRHSFRDHLEERMHISAVTSGDTVFTRQQSYDFHSSARLDNFSYILYGEDRWTLPGQLEAQYGLRVHYFSYNKQLTVDPRLQLKWTFSPDTWLAASWGIYSQPPQYRELRDSNHTLLTNVRAQQSNKSVLSFYHHTSRATISRVELFYITQKHLIPYDFEDIFIQYQPELTGSGRAYGLNVHWYGKLNQRLNSWLSYTYLVSRQRIPGLGNDEFPSPTDQRNTVSVVLQDDMPNIPNMKAHVRVLFGSGYPYTAYTAKLDEETGIYYPESFNRMGYRMAYYRRMDVGLSYSKRLWKSVDAKMMFEIFNIFDFRNVLSYKYFILQSGHWQDVRNNLSRRIFNFRVNILF